MPQRRHRVTIRAYTPAIKVFVSGESSMRHTRHAAIATIAIAFGLALTTIGINRGLPHEVGGIGSRLTVAADAWASGSAVSPPLVLLTIVAMLAAIAVRETRGGARAASWLAVVASIGIVAGLMEPHQQRVLLFQERDLLLAGLLYASHATWIALIVACVGRARRGSTAPVEAVLAGSSAAPAAA
ncbi:MAG TPA: hypothetical protein VFO05_04660 [Candidatus Limnocylindrales bacterium]|nr:hypothetical protein [Candidatus Limnocylindrales bacterium]